MSQQPLRQLELNVERQRERDRNHHLGGRSFYFFDFDDNVAFLSTPLYLFHNDGEAEIAISSGDFAQFHSTIGQHGPFKDYKINYDDAVGTFRAFRDHSISDLEKLVGRKQIFIQDVGAALGYPDLAWKGPSWDCFYHATFNQRPVSLITARGHHPETIVAGVDVFVEKGFLPARPNYLSVFPVSHKETRVQLGDGELKESVAALKQKAIRASVEKALDLYGDSPHHRFGMSDDDPKNVQLILEEMMRLKEEYPQMSFFIIETQKGEYVKKEVLLRHDYHEQKLNSSQEQIALFES